MDKIWDRNTWKSEGHWPLWRGCFPTFQLPTIITILYWLTCYII